jgi:RNA polymerase sigma-70 factor, ECF subfamily
MIPSIDIGKAGLVDLLKNKEKEGFSQLYDEYAATLLGILRRMVNSVETAEDLLQDVFVKVWKNIHAYDPSKGSFFTWLLNITRNTALDHFRSKQYKQQQKSIATDEREEQFGGTFMPDVESTGVRNLVGKLEPKYREVIDLIYFWGYTQDEVSKLLDVPLGTVKTRARAGLQLLRSNFNH